MLFFPPDDVVLEGDSDFETGEDDADDEAEEMERDAGGDKTAWFPPNADDGPTSPEPVLPDAAA